MKGRAASDVNLAQVAFVKRRRAAAADAVADMTRSEAGQEIRATPAGASWSVSHAKGGASAKNKTQQRRSQASREGALLPVGDTPGLQAAAAAHIEKMKVDQLKRERLQRGRLSRTLGGQSAAPSTVRGLVQFDTYLRVSLLQGTCSDSVMSRMGNHSNSCGAVRFDRGVIMFPWVVVLGNVLQGGPSVFYKAAELRWESIWTNTSLDGAAACALATLHGMAPSSSAHSVGFCLCAHSRISNSSTSSREHWVAILRGVPLLSPGVSGASSPPLVLRHKAVLDKKRVICVTGAFKFSYPSIFEVIMRCAQLHSRHKWRF